MREVIIFILLVVFSFKSVGNREDNKINPITQLIDSCWFYMERSDSINSKRLCTKLLWYSKKNIDNYNRADIYSTAGNFYLLGNNYEKSIWYYQQAIEIAKNLKGKRGRLLYANCLSNYAVVFYTNGDYYSALEKYIMAEKIFYIYNEYNKLTDVYNKLGGINYALIRMDKAYEYNEKAFKYGMKSTKKNVLIRAYICHANNLLDSDSLEAAYVVYNKALEIAKEIDSKINISTIYYNMAFGFSQQEKYNKALRLYQISYKYAVETGEIDDICDVLYKIGLMHQYLKEYEKARKIMLEVLETARKHNLLKYHRNALEVLSNIEYETGNYKKAIDYSHDYIDKIYEIYSEEDQKQINFMNGKFQAQKREADIFKLKSEKEIQAEKIRKINILLLTGLFLILLIAFSGTLTYRFFKQKQKIISQENEIQKHKITELENEKMLLATQSVLQGEETERQRIARDLHDGLGGLLTGVKFKFTTMKGNVLLTEDSVMEFDRAIEMLDSSITELRRIAHNMMPESLLRLGLKDALDDFCGNFGKSQKINIKYQYIGIFQRIEQQMEINIYRIVQEIIYNAIKHSGGSELLVQIIQETKRIGLIFQDNGTGFDSNTSKQGKGIGLNSVQSRVNSMKGRIDIYSAPGKGTEINIEFPLE